MDFGVSTACYYPLYTELAFETLAKAGVKIQEIFFNSPCELQKEYVGDLCKLKDAYGVQVPSIHPFTSGFEPFLLFSGYSRRFYDGLAFYERYLEAAEALGAHILVIHGDRKESRIPNTLYFERFSMLVELGRKYGVTVCQENVCRCKSFDPAFIREMKRELGEDAAFVLDVKQCVRAGVDVFDMLAAMGEKMFHLHISDHTDGQDCLAPGKGDFDTARLLRELPPSVGSVVIELYRCNFEGEAELLTSLQFLESEFNRL